jgi:Lrp/AsnC family leucine-responsive transcriptional regulator
MKLDETDRSILRVLQVDGRITNADLATEVGLSPSAALRRTRALERTGVIAGYTALIDHRSLGRGTTVFIEISLTAQSGHLLDEFEAAVTECPEVVDCHLMAGDFDYLVQVVCADVSDYERIHRDWLSKMPGVDRIRSSFALRAVGDPRRQLDDAS